MAEATRLCFVWPNALDEDGVKKIRNIVAEEKERGSIVLLASHNKEDIEMLADKVYYMVDGRIRDKGVED